MECSVFSTLAPSSARCLLVVEAKGAAVFMFNNNNLMGLDTPVSCKPFRVRFDVDGATINGRRSEVNI